MSKKLWLGILIAVLLISGSGIGIYFYQQDHDPEIFMQQSEKLFQVEKYHEALKYCLAAEALMHRIKKEQSEEYALLLLKKGEIYYFLNQFDESRNCSLSAKEIFSALGQNRCVIAANANIGQLAFSQKNYHEAILFLDEALTLNSQMNYLPTSNQCTAQWYLALSYYHLKKYDKAKLEFYLCLDLMSAKYGENSIELSRNYNYLGNVCLGTKDISKAQQHFQSALDILQNHHPDMHIGHANNYWGLAKSFSLSNDPLNAEIFAEKAIKQYQQKISLLTEQGNDDKQEMVLLYYEMGGWLYEFFRYDESIQFYKAALDVPDIGEYIRFKIYSNLAASYMQKRNYIESQKFYGKADEILNNNFHGYISNTDKECLYSNFAVSCLKNGDYKHAIALFHKSLKFIPEIYGYNSESEIKTYYHLADAYYHIENYSDAEEFYLRTLKHFSVDKDPLRFKGAICWGMSKVYQKRNNIVSALKYANEALDCFKKSPVADTRIEEINNWLNVNKAKIK